MHLCRLAILSMRQFLLFLVLFFYSYSTIAQSKVKLSKPITIDIQDTSLHKWHFLKDVLANKSIVCLGESLHGVKEYNETKLKLIQYLHEEMGFSVLAVEADVAMTYFAGKYRQQMTDTMMLADALSPVWHTETHLQLMNYLQKNPQLKLIGFDIWNTNILQELSAQHIYKSDPEDAFLEVFYTPLEKDDEQFWHKRDSIMAANLLTISKLYKDEKIIISAANAHISRSKTRDYDMGNRLAHHFGEAYFAIGFFHSLGNPTHIYRDVFYQNELDYLPQNSLQYRLLQQPEDVLFLDLNHLRRTKKWKWLDTPTKHILLTKKYEYEVHIADSFDAILWLREVTHPNYVIESPYHLKQPKKQ